VSRFVLVVDQGTTSTKVSLVDDQGVTRVASAAEFPQYFPAPGWVEHDPEDLWRTTLDQLRAVSDAARVGAHGVAALAIANQRETVVVWDRRSGEPLYPAIVWQDRRTSDECEALTREGAEWVTHRTGLRLDPYFSATKIAWILDHVAGARERAQRGDLAAGTVDSWLIFRLTSGRAHVTDVTNASRTLLMNLATGTWDEELCEFFRVPSGVLAEIRPSVGFFGHVDAQWLSAAVPIGAVIGDQQAALVGQGCLTPGATKSTYGTGSFVLQHTGASPVTSTGSLLATAACADAASSAQYAVEGSIFVTGAALQWLRDGLGLLESAGESEDLARSLSDNGDVWFVPALTGLGAPHWDPRARGILVGLTRGVTRAHLARAALESIAFQTRDVLDAMNHLCGHSLPALRVDGGATANRWLMQFQADVVGVPVVVAPSAEATMRGATLAGGSFAGWWRLDDQRHDEGRTGERFEPRMSEDEREYLYSRWSRALERSLDWSE